MNSLINNVDELNPALYLGAFVGLIGTLLVLSSYRSNKSHPLPPGPPGLPLIGNAHQLLGKNIVTVMEKWANEYGPVVHINVFGQSIIIVSSSEAAKELLETRHQVYSGRPNFLLASEAMQGGMMMPFIHANERFRRVRKLVTTEMRPAAVATYFNPIQTAEVRRLVKGMIDEPKNWRATISRAIASIIMSAVYDKPLRTGEEAGLAVKNVVRLNDELVAAIDAGKNYVDFIPWIRHIPYAPYKRAANEYYQLAETTYKGLMDEAKQNLEQGLPAAGVAARLLSAQAEVEADYREQYWALGSFYLAGSDTQSVSSQILMLALAEHPHVLKRCQIEIDQVVGADRLPTYDDESRLPYIKATVRELFRWRPVGPIAIPHASTKDDVYMGYFIPSGSQVIPNIWSMHMDPSVFENPQEFNPQRYIDNPSLPGHVFGFGRRVCPGQRVAEQTLFLELATVVWALEIRRGFDPMTGKPTPINIDRETGFAAGGVMKPNPFPITIMQRSSERTDLLFKVVDEQGL